MAAPEIKILSCSNVYTRSMHFVKKGDIEYGHKHPYDHATLVSRGSVLVEIMDEGTSLPEFSKVFYAPNMIFINKDKLHRLISLEDDTVCSCIHAIRTIDETIVDPDFLIEPVETFELRSQFKVGEISDMVQEKYNKELLYFTSQE